MRRQEDGACISPAKEGGSAPADGDGLQGEQTGIVGRVVLESAFGLRFSDAAGITPARQVIGSRVAAATAAATHAKLGFEIGQRPGPGSDGFLDLAFRDRITYANKHENNYQLRNSFWQSSRFIFL